MCNCIIFIIQYTEQIQKGDLYNVSAYASDAVRALAEALHRCIWSHNGCSRTELDWNITFTGDTVGYFNNCTILLIVWLNVYQCNCCDVSKMYSVYTMHDSMHGFLSGGVPSIIHNRWSF